VAVTFTASYHKILDPDPRIGFLAHAKQLATEVPKTGARAHELSRLIFNDRLDALVTGLLLLLVVMILAESVLEWVPVLSGRKVAQVSEAPFVASRYPVEEA
jgi:carbon starvation protein